MQCIQSINEAEQNAKEFNRLTKNSNSEALDVFSQFFHWYYFPNENIFAPSKFIGYRGTTIDNYDGSGTGSETQAVLTQWFRKIPPHHSQYQQLQAQLEAYGHSLDKNISRRTWTQGGIYLPRT